MDGLLQQMMQGEIRTQVCTVCPVVFNLNCTVYRGELNRRGRLGFRTLCCDVFGLLKNLFLRNNNNKGSQSNVNKHELVYGESSSNARDAPDVCLSFVLLFTIFIIVVTQTNSSAVQKHHSKVYGTPIAPSFYSILLAV